MGKIETKELSFTELYDLQRTIQGEIAEKQEDLEHVKRTLRARNTVNTLKNTHVEMKTNSRASSCCINVKTASGYNVCKVYGVGSHDSRERATVRAHQITMIPRLLKFLAKVADPRTYGYELKDEARGLFDEASAANMVYKETGKVPSTYASNGKSTVYTLTKKEDE